MSYDPCDPYSPYYDPDYCYWLKYGYYPDDPALSVGYGQSYRAPRVTPSQARRKTYSIARQQSDPKKTKTAIDASATDRSSNSTLAEVAIFAGEQDIRVPLVSSIEAPQALPDERSGTK